MSIDTLRKFFFDREKNRYAIGLILVAALIIRMLLFTGGVRGSDAYAYALHAFQIASGQYDINAIESFYGFRYALLLPTALSYCLFGVNDYASVLFLYLSSLLNILVVFFLAQEIFDRKTAFVASVLLAIYPLDIATSNTLSPDSFIPLFSSLAILFYVKAEKKWNASQNAGGFLFLAGIAIALAYLSRITSIFVFAALVLYHLFRNYKISSLIWVAIALAIPLGGEALYYTIATGDPLFHFHRIAVHESLVKGADPDAIVSLLFYPKVMFGFDLTGWAFYGLLWWMVLAGLLIAVMQRDKKILLPAFFLVIPFLGFEFGTQSLKEMIPIMKNYNYLSLITAPAVIIAGYALNEGFHLLFHDGRRGIKILIIVMICIAAMNFYGAYRLALNVKDDAGPYLAVADVLKEQNPQPIYVHHGRWPLFLKYFLRYDQGLDFRTLNEMNQEQIQKISHAYIILHKRYLIADTAGRRLEQLPKYSDYWSNPPENWERLLLYSGNPPYNTVALFYAK